METGLHCLSQTCQSSSLPTMPSCAVVLFTHPAVREAAVVAIPDPYSGERPMAYIALKEGQTATEEALITYCKEHLATFKVPCLIKFPDELPKLSTGKVLRRVLRDETR